MLESLVRLRTWGGNLLVNVSPRPTGELPEVVYERLVTVQSWMAHSGCSVIGITAAPSTVEASVAVTVGAGITYLHALPSFSGHIEVRGLARPASVTLLRTGQALYTRHENQKLQIEIRIATRTPLIDTVAVR